MARLRKPPLPVERPIDLRLMEAATRVLWLLAFAVFVGLLLTWAMRSPVFTLRGIRIEGDVGRNNVTTVRANALPRLTGNFFSLDLAQAKAAFESVPWVRRATVARVWPDALVVRLEEHRAAAWWQMDEGDDQLVNVQGEVFQANPGDVEDDNLPTLRGPAGTAASLLAMQRRLEPLFAPLDLHVDSLAMSARGSLRAVLDSGAEIELGRGSEAEVLARVQQFAGTVTELTQRYGRPIQGADLRHVGGYALRLRGIGTTAPDAKK